MDDEETINDIEEKKWRVLLQLSAEKMASRRLTLQLIKHVIQRFYGSTIEIFTSCENSDPLLLDITFRGPHYPREDAYMNVRAFESSMLENVLVLGMENLTKVFTVAQTITTTSQEKDGHGILESHGSNLKRVLWDYHDVYINGDRTHTNDVFEVSHILGIEAARQALLNEITAVIEDASTHINSRHLTLLVDTMTSRGTLMPIDRHGINRVDAGPLAKASFEETKDMIVHASVFGEKDRVNGVSANVMLGQIPPCGTGDVDIMLDDANLPIAPISMIKKMEKEGWQPCVEGEKFSRFEFSWTKEDLVVALGKEE